MIHEKENIRSVSILRALQLGDLLCSVPALRALRNALPQAHISIMGMPWMKSFVERYSHYLDEFIWFPGYPGLPEQPVHPQATADFITEMIKRNFDLAIQMQGNGSIINPLIALLGANQIAGYCRMDDYCPDSSLFITYPNGISEIHRHLTLMQHLGFPSASDHLEFPITGKDIDDLKNTGISIEHGKYICVHPGSRGTWRQWPAAYFARVADECAEKGWQIVLTGTKEEMPIVEEVISNMVSEPIVAAGKTSLGAIGALLKNAAGLISNCTGVSHIASALKTKSVVISMDGEPERWAPLNSALHIMIDWTKNEDVEKVSAAVDEHFASVP
jgi:ADP-heptose:LPS heptosyltransferase